MIKKEYFFVFVIAGLAVVYGVLAAVNFFTRGRFKRVLKKKLVFGTMLITFTSLMTIGSFAQNVSDPLPTPVYGTPVPTLDPTPEYGTPIQTPTPIPSAIPTPAYGVPYIPGDVNWDFDVNIVDALLIAQYYVGAIPDGFIRSNADVNRDDKINIVDALLVAQKYVGSIDEFPEGK